jgi:hypothetical protein
VRVVARSRVDIRVLESDPTTQTEAMVNARQHDGLIHELSIDGRRPLCGEAVPNPDARDSVPVNCDACLRLLDDDARRAARAALPSVHDSED